MTFLASLLINPTSELTLGEIGETEVLWGTSYAQWRVVRGAEKIDSFLAAEEEASNSKSFKIYLPQGQLSAFIYDAEKTVRQVLDRLKHRDDLAMGLQAYSMKGVPLDLEMKLSELKDRAICYGTDILTWIEHKEKEAASKPPGETTPSKAKGLVRSSLRIAPLH